MKWQTAGALFVFLGIGSAGAQPPPPGYAPIPPLRHEFVPLPPGERVVWEPGHWQWNGFRYIWIGGHYVERQPQFIRYVPGHWGWRPREGRWIWRPAHWE